MSHVEFGPCEHVYVELDWWDGPRAGIADIGGVPHRFQSIFDDDKDEWDDAFLILPVSPQTLALEIEIYRIFVAWNDKYNAGLAVIAEHPAHKGVDARWDELEEILKPDRLLDPTSAKRAWARVEFLKRDRGYDESGPNYAMR